MGRRIAALLAALVAATSGHAAAQIGPTHPERRPIIENAYAETLGRAPDEYELFWWTLYADQPPGVINAGSLRRALLQRLANSAEERAGAATRVRAQTGAQMPEPQLEALVASAGFARAVRTVRAAP